MGGDSHENDVECCLLCADKLRECHPKLVKWFLKVIKPLYPEAHIAWGYRNREQQADMVKRNASKLVYPKSKHNKVGLDKKPCSEAVDIFELHNGQAYFRSDFYAAINAHTKNMGWGEVVEQPLPERDANHFELKG